MYLPFELFCVIADVVLSRLLGTILLAAGAGILLAWIREDYTSLNSVGLQGEGLVAAGTGSRSFAQLTALLASLGCVLGGVYLWMR